MFNVCQTLYIFIIRLHFNEQTNPLIQKNLQHSDPDF